MIILFKSEHLKVQPLLTEKLQLHYTCGYWMEGMLAVIPTYSSIEEIIDDCNSCFCVITQKCLKMKIEGQ